MEKYNEETDWEFYWQKTSKILIIQEEKMFFSLGLQLLSNFTLAIFPSKCKFLAPFIHSCSPQNLLQLCHYFPSLNPDPYLILSVSTYSFFLKASPPRWYPGSSFCYYFDSLSLKALFSHRVYLCPSVCILLANFSLASQKSSMS